MAHDRNMSYLTDYEEIDGGYVYMDEISGILKSFITGIENLVDHKVKTHASWIIVCQILFGLEAVNTACYVQNKVLVVKPHNKTTYELFHGRTPTLSFLRPFGCPVTILKTIDNLGKFDGNTDEGSLLDTLVNRWLFDIDATNKIMNYEPVVADPKSSHDDGSKPSSDDGKKVDEDPRKDSECKDQEKEDNVNSTNNVNTAGNVNTYYSIFDFSSDDEDDGVVADMNNLDTTIQVDDTWAWVAMGLKRKPDAAAGAPRVAQNAPIRMARLEEDVHKIRRALTEQCEVIDVMAHDFSRFTWAVTGLARMMDRAGVTYMPNSETHVPYQRCRVRQRTGEANTSAA
ncbi:hypothetical protein Tco_0669821 [Tanacetum coccineum]